MRISIKNFKSIEHVDIELGRLTILTGPPSAGKSNILEAIALLGYLFRLTLKDLYTSPQVIRPSLSKVLRFSQVEDLLFYREKRKGVYVGATIGNERFSITIRFGERGIGVKVNNDLNLANALRTLLSGQALQTWPSITKIPPLDVRLYGYDRYGLTQDLQKTLDSQPQYIPKIPLSEDANNIVAMLNEYHRIYLMINSWLEELGMKISVGMLRNGRPTILDHYKEVPPRLLSDTLGRVLYYVTALYTCMEYAQIKSMKDKLVILLEEPEAHVFPYSFQLLVDILKEATQSFYVVLTTHNGSFISHLWNKLKDVKTYYVFREQKTGATVVTELDIEKLAKDLVTGNELLLLTPKEVTRKYIKQS